MRKQRAKGRAGSRTGRGGPGQKRASERASERERERESGLRSDGWCVRAHGRGRTPSRERVGTPSRVNANRQCPTVPNPPCLHKSLPPSDSFTLPSPPHGPETLIVLNFGLPKFSYMKVPAAQPLMLLNVGLPKFSKTTAPTAQILIVLHFRLTKI